jgi:hypothetical protein
MIARPTFRGQRLMHVLAWLWSARLELADAVPASNSPVSTTQVSSDDATHQPPASARPLRRTLRAFYEKYFGLRDHVMHGDILFMRDADDGLDLALAPASTLDPFPEWFHFGFRLEAPDAVASMHARPAGGRGWKPRNSSGSTTSSYSAVTIPTATSSRCTGSSA